MLDDIDSQELLLPMCNLLAQGKVLAVIGTDIDGSPVDRTDETQRWRVRDCHRLHGASVRRKNVGQTVHEGVRSGVFSVPIRFVHPSGHRLRWTFVARSY